MKLYKSLISCIILILIIGCSKSKLVDLVPDPDQVGGQDDRVAVQAKVDGIDFKAPYSKSRAGINESSFFVEGFTMLEDRMILLVTDDFQGVGTYPFIKIDGDYASFAEYSEIDQPSQTNNQTWMSPWDEDVVEGEFIISHLSETNVKGSFYLKATNYFTNEIKNITEGSFDVRLYR